MSIFIKDACVITMNESHDIYDPGGIVIYGNSIVAVGSMDSVELAQRAVIADVVIDAKGMIVMPGMIDAHYHCSQQLERGIYDTIIRMGKMKHPSWGHFLIPWESQLTEGQARLSHQAACANALLSGTTFISEHGGVFPHVLAETYERVGVRGHVAMSTMDMDPTGIGFPDSMLFGTDEAIGKGLELVQTYPFRRSGLARGVFSLRQILVCTPELITRTIALAEKYGTMVQTHSNEGHYETEYAHRVHSLRPVEYLVDINGISDRVIAAHSVLMSDAEVKLFAQYNVGVAHCPRGNFGGLGPAKLPLMRWLNIDQGIGSDGACGGSTGLIGLMRESRVCQNLLYGAPYMDRGAVAALDLFEMATIGGARVVGLADEIGSLESGKRADILVLEPNIHSVPTTDPVNTVVSSMDDNNVCHVFVDGRHVVQNGILTTIDAEGLAHEVNEQAPRMQEAFVNSR